MNHPLTPFETTLHRDEFYKERIIGALQKKMKKDYASGAVKRDAHPKNLGLLQAEFTVENDLPDDLRVGIFKEAHLAKQEASFDFLVQKFKDQGSTPIEDAAVEWKEADAPFHKVATLRIPMQVFRTAEREALSEDFSFSPGHCLTEHRPIGGINRARMEIYNRLSQFRHQESNRPLVEPVE